MHGVEQINITEVWQCGGKHLTKKELEGWIDAEKMSRNWNSSSILEQVEPPQPSVARDDNGYPKSDMFLLY